MAHLAPLRRLLVPCLLAGLALTAGCNEGPPPAKLAKKDEKPAAATPAPVAPAAKVELKAVDSKEVQAFIKAQKGKIVVVDFWATWCDPCKREFPHLVELHRAHAKDGVVCISVSLNEESDQAAALKFLQAQEAAFPNFRLKEDQEVWQKTWSIKAIPVVLVFDQEGDRAKKFDNDDSENPFTYADVTKLVEKLLRGKE